MHAILIEVEAKPMLDCCDSSTTRLVLRSASEYRLCMSNGALRGGIAALAGPGPGWNLAGMAAEALMVVFAVLVAFGVEEWREERQLRQFAESARVAIELEMAENLDEFRSSQQSLRDLLQRLAAIVRADDESDPVFSEGSIEIAFSLPNVSSAAWRTAQTSQAAPYFDYDWIIRVSQVYDILGAWERARDLMLDSISLVLARVSTGVHPLDIREDLYRLNGRLLLLEQAHAEVQGRLDELLAGDETSSTSE